MLYENAQHLEQRPPEQSAVLQIGKQSAVIRMDCRFFCFFFFLPRIKDIFSISEFVCSSSVTEMELSSSKSLSKT